MSNDQVFTPEAVVEIDPGMELPRTELEPSMKWPNLKVGTTARGTYSVPQNSILYRAVARAMVRSEQVLNIIDANVGGYEGYSMVLRDNSVRTILFYNVRAITGNPYLLEMVDGKMVWATNKIINYVGGRQSIRDTGVRIYIPATWADGQVHACYTVLTQNFRDGGLTAPMLSRSLFFKNAQRFAADQDKLGLTIEDRGWINPICHPNTDYFTAALAHGAILGIRTNARPEVVNTIAAFMSDERRIIAKQAYQN